MPTNYSVALNFFPIDIQTFHFAVYRKDYSGESKVGIFENLEKKNLPIDPSQEINNKNNRKDYWISFEPLEGFTEFLCRSDYNNFLTQSMLFYILKKKVINVLNDDDFFIPQKQLRKAIYFTIKQHQIGKETVWIEPFFLKSHQKIGFLIDFKFYKNYDVPFNKLVQQLSLSLDKFYRQNTNFYIDKLDKIKTFVAKYIDKIFPLNIGSNYINIETNLYKLQGETLSVKKYIFANNKESNSQFIGIKNFGPIFPINNEVLFYFISRNQDKDYANDLYKALRGKTFPSKFPGMEKIFNISLDIKNVKGKLINEFNEENILEIIEEIKNCREKLVIPIIVFPKEKNIYYLTKFLFTKYKIPFQSVTIDLLKNSKSLEWSISNIGLQVFTKLGGKPWIVKPRKDNCLTIGIGQSHKVNKFSTNKKIERYFAYSVLTDTSGLYKDLKILGSSDREDIYLDDFKDNIGRIFEEYKKDYNKFVVHTPFKIKRKELDLIKKMIKETVVKEDFLNTDFLVLKINVDNKYFGYNLDTNSCIPYESTYIKLSWNEYLLWFEGLQFHNPNIHKRISGPTHIEFYYSNKQLQDLSEAEKQSYLQDTINLSGANWRGFNAKSLPVSIYYCQLISNFIKEFDEYHFKGFEIDNSKPWFL